MQTQNASRLSASNLRLVESAILLALSTVLSLVKIYQMPLGGSVTLCSMLPVLLIGYKYGVEWGLLTSFTYGVIQLLLDLGAALSWGLTPQALAASIVFDYLLAFASLGLAGIWGRGFPKFVAGLFTAVALRFAFHVISGVTAYASWLPKEWGNHLFLYSLAYNGSFLLPDFLICLAVGVALYHPLQRFLEPSAG
ncbi:MAG TPA: energy-coupled thiamine transporter ThiT [Ruminococcaceae bacterium]|jgi:thiamine transporter|nr:energy-coupled thiamine transporter ThiT [Oscillospiraceae bacterium]HBT91490.1 energy-coupled thiamine transporter ThiT [Oscillospiraceae bacterium]